MIRLPIGIMRLLAAGALAQGLSLDEYVESVLTERAEQIRESEVRAERLSMRMEKKADAWGWWSKRNRRVA